MFQLPFQQGLIVSCQAYAGEPMFGSPFMAAYAKAGELGGAVAVHSGLIADLVAIKQTVALPLIGMHKGAYSRTSPYITTTFEQAAAIAHAGADVIEIDATLRPRTTSVRDLIDYIHHELGKPVLAGTSCIEDVAHAIACGADAISTFLAGYTEHGRAMTDGPDFEFIRDIAAHTHLPIVAEGRFKTPQQAQAAAQHGAYAVLVAAAISKPQDITRGFVEALSRS